MRDYVLRQRALLPDYPPGARNAGGAACADQGREDVRIACPARLCLDQCQSGMAKRADASAGLCICQCGKPPGGVYGRMGKPRRFASGSCPTPWCRSGILSSVGCVIRLPFLAS